MSVILWILQNLFKWYEVYCGMVCTYCNLAYPNNTQKEGKCTIIETQPISPLNHRGLGTLERLSN
jgi:hypothetical protein